VAGGRHQGQRLAVQSKTFGVGLTDARAAWAHRRRDAVADDGPPASFGTFTPGWRKVYTASTTATVISTAR
jgi:hypothetical protein